MRSIEDHDSITPAGAWNARLRWMRRGIVLLIGMVLLAGTFRFGYDNGWFYALSALLGGCWTIGWWLDRGGAPLVVHGPRPVLRAIGLGAAAGTAVAAGCVVGAIALRDAPVIGASIMTVIGPVDASVLVPVLATAVVVGAGEELMFRSAVYRWFETRPVAGSTLVYVIVTLATGSLSLLVAATVLGAATGWLRFLTGTVLAPLACHVTWSLLSLAVLPRIVTGV